MGLAVGTCTGSDPMLVRNVRSTGPVVRVAEMPSRVRRRDGGLRHVVTVLLMLITAKVVSTDNVSAADDAGLRSYLLEGDASRHVSSPGDDAALLNVNPQQFGAVRGLGATKALRRGEVAVWVPERLSLSTRTSSMPAQVLNRFVPRPEHGLRTVNLAAILLFEASLGNASKFYQHIGSFPKDTPRNSATWSSSQKAVFGSVVGMQGSDCDVHLPVFVQNLLAVADKNPGQLAAVLQMPLGQWTVWNSTELRRQTQWACAMAISRNFGGSLYPMLDMANHNTRAVWGEGTISIDFSPSCVPQLLQCFPRPGVLTRSNGQAVRPLRCVQSVRKRCISSDAMDGEGRGIVALQEFDAGEQIFDNYGQQSNLKLLFQWGFIDESNEAGTDAIFDWRSVSFIWEDYHHQSEWMSLSTIPALAHCARLFDKLSIVQAGASTLPDLRLNLNQTAAPHGFNVPAIDCIRILVQNFTSESELKEELSRGSLYPRPLQWSNPETDGVVLGMEGATSGDDLPGCGDASDGMRSQVDRRVLQIVAASCTKIADRIAAAQVLPAYASVYDEVLQDVEQPGASLQTSKHIIHWIQMELNAANACVSVITEWLSESNPINAQASCLGSKLVTQ